MKIGGKLVEMKINTNLVMSMVSKNKIKLTKTVERQPVDSA